MLRRAQSWILTDFRWKPSHGTAGNIGSWSQRLKERRDDYLADDNRPTWKPFTEYIERWGDRRRAEGKKTPNVADNQYWEERRKFEAMKDQPKKAAIR
jgi:hypothetical protein